MEKDIIIRPGEVDEEKPAAKEITMEVEHDPIGQKFFIHLGTSEAVLAYTQVNNILDMHTTIVPEAFRGQGLAEKLCVAAFEFVRKNNLKAIPSCPYISKKFLPEHPEFKDLVTDSYF